MHTSGVSPPPNPLLCISGRGVPGARDAGPETVGAPTDLTDLTDLKEHPMSTTRTTFRTGGRWLLAAAVVFVAGYALVVLVEPGGLATELGVAVPLVAAAVLLVIGTATVAAASPVRPLALAGVLGVPLARFGASATM